MAGDGGHSREQGPGAVRPGALSALLQEIAAAPPSGGGGEGWDSGLRAGAAVGRFELVREIGRGGFGVVWEAKDRELGRRVAFKAVRAGSRRELREERLLREAEAAARLTHPNIVTLHDVGRSEHGPYLVLELLEGRTLAERLAQGALPVGEAVRIAIEIAKGLAHAHAHGVVHRDLKPENVFLCDDGQVKVLDFGLAHAFGRRRADGGTPSYMAPEQAEGSPEDERTDVWALGVILFELLSGKRPFEDEEALRRPAPSVEVEGSPALGALVARMLSARPVDRLRDGSEVLAELLALEREHAQAVNSTAVAVSVKRPPRLRLPAAIIAMSMFVALLAAALLSRGGAPGKATGDRIVVAVADVVNETGERELDVLSGLLVTSLEQSRKLSVMTQARVLDLAVRAGRKDASRVDEAIGREVGKAQQVRTLLLPGIRRLGTTYFLEMRAIDPVRDEHLFTLSDRSPSKGALLDLLDRLSERTRTELGERPEEIEKSRVQLGDALTRSVEAYQHYVAGLEARFRYGLRAAALAEFRKALEFDPGFAAAHAQLAGLFHTYARADLSVEHWRAAETGIERMPVKERTILQLQRAFDTETLVGWSEADSLRLAGEIEARFPDDKFALAFAAAAHDTFGQRDRAERALRRALELDPGYFLAAWALNDLVGPADALVIARRAVAASRSSGNLWLLAEALRVTGDENRAAETAREILRGEGGRNSLLAQVACDTLYQVGSAAECLPIWRRMAVEGQNEYERDFARFKLMDAFAFHGRIREALRVPGPGWDPDRVSSPHHPARFSTRPGMLVAILQVGFPRKEAPRALEHARRITHPQYRRNWLAFLGAREEAEALHRSLEGKGFDIVDDVYRYYGLVDQGRLEEAIALARTLGEAVRRGNIATSLFGVALLEAEALLAAGRTAEVAELWPAPLPCRCSDPLDYATNYPRLALLRARAREQLGHRADAIRELDGVLAFWKEADPDLPLLVEAKAMRKRLAAGPSASRHTAVPALSIAVLPFADLSPGKDQEYFSDGVAEEILNALTQVQGLRVVGRTSSFSFKGKKDDLRSIGRKLEVAHVLEGSVRRDGGRIRITAQLVKAADGYRLWSQTYERELTSVFQIQDEVARAVVTALEVKLLGGGAPDSPRPGPTTSPEAYNQYLLGRQFYRRFSPEDFRRAIQAYEHALELDPRFAPAWSGLGVPLFYLARKAATREKERSQLLRALAAVEKALELSPDLADGLSVRGFLRQALAWDWEGARADLERAVRLYPSDADAWRRYAVLLDNLGRTDEAIAAAERAVRLDPLGHSGLKLGHVLAAAGRREAARASYQRAREILPDSPYPRWNLAGVWLLEGRAQEALEVFEELAAAGVESQKDVARALYSVGRIGEAEAALEGLKSRQPRPRPLDIASACAWMERPDCAFAWLERALQERDSEMGEAFRTNPEWRSLHSDPRWKALLRRMNLPVD